MSNSNTVFTDEQLLAIITANEAARAAVPKSTSWLVIEAQGKVHENASRFGVGYRKHYIQHAGGRSGFLRQKAIAPTSWECEARRVNENKDGAAGSEVRAPQEERKSNRYEISTQILIRYMPGATVAAHGDNEARVVDKAYVDAILDPEAELRAARRATDKVAAHADRVESERAAAETAQDAADAAAASAAAAPSNALLADRSAKLAAAADAAFAALDASEGSAPDFEVTKAALVPAMRTMLDAEYLSWQVDMKIATEYVRLMGDIRAMQAIGISVNKASKIKTNVQMVNKYDAKRHKPEEQNSDGFVDRAQPICRQDMMFRPDGTPWASIYDASAGDKRAPLARVKRSNGTTEPVNASNITEFLPRYSYVQSVVEYDSVLHKQGATLRCRATRLSVVPGRRRDTESAGLTVGDQFAALDITASDNSQLRRMTAAPSSPQLDAPAAPATSQAATNFDRILAAQDAHVGASDDEA